MISRVFILIKEREIDKVRGTHHEHLNFVPLPHVM